MVNDARPSDSGSGSRERDCETVEWNSGSVKLGRVEGADGAATHTLVIPNPLGRYTIDRLLGRGSMGAVFLAFDEHLQRQVALKIPLMHGDEGGPWKERFLREARAVANLRHPNVCPVFDAGEAQGILYLTMAYIQGRPLSALVERGPIKQAEAVELARTVARAMQVAHSVGTLHRDLKPANIMVDSGGQPVVMDFGLARTARWNDEQAAPLSERDLDVTQFGSILGTLPYMPPEQARGDHAAVGPWSDVYSLGVILYELLTNRRPFAARGARELLRMVETEPPPRPADYYPWFDRALEAACLKALAKNPVDRFQTMGEFERALAAATEVNIR